GPAAAGPGHALCGRDGVAHSARRARTGRLAQLEFRTQPRTPPAARPRRPPPYRVMPPAPHVITDGPRRGHRQLWWPCTVRLGLVAGRSGRRRRRSARRPRLLALVGGVAHARAARYGGPPDLLRGGPALRRASARTPPRPLAPRDRAGAHAGAHARLPHHAVDALRVRDPPAAPDFVRGGPDRARSLPLVQRRHGARLGAALHLDRLWLRRRGERRARPRCPRRDVDPGRRGRARS